MRQDEFERLYEEHARPLLAFLEYRTGDLELARDIHADTFVRVLTTRWRFDPRKASQKTWLYTIALNTLRDHMRRKGAEKRAMARLTTGEAGASFFDAEAVDERATLMKAFARLSEEEREAVALRYGADMPLEEIARATGTRTTTIKGRLHRGLRKLRDELD